MKWLMNQCRLSIKCSSMSLIKCIDKNGWKNDFQKRIGQLSSWPGKESADGLRSEHLSPDCGCLLMDLAVDSQRIDR